MDTTEKRIVPKELDDLIQEYLTDGIISAKERQVLLNKAQALGLNLDEVDLYIDAQEQKMQQSIEAAKNKRRGKTCPFCGSSIPELTDKCPNCGGNITPEASKELAKIIEHLESALEDFKSGKYTEENKAKIERFTRQARMYYGNNPKIQRLVEEVEEESEAAEAAAKKKSLWENIKNVTAVVVSVGLFLILLGICFYESHSSDRAEEERQEWLKKLQDAKEQTQSLGSQVFEMIESGNLDRAKNTLTSFSVPNEFSGMDLVQNFDAIYLALIKAYIKKGNYDEAEEVGNSFRLKINSDFLWEDTSSYKTLKKEFKKKGRDFSALKAE